MVSSFSRLALYSLEALTNSSRSLASSVGRAGVAGFFLPFRCAEASTENDAAISRSQTHSGINLRVLTSGFRLSLINYHLTFVIGHFRTFGVGGLQNNK